MKDQDDRGGGRRPRRALWLAVSAVTTLATLSAVAVQPARATTTPVWARYRFDTNNTGFNPYETSLSRANIGSLAQDWSTRATSGGSAMIAGGVVYVGCDPVSFCALDATDGSVRWKTQVGDSAAPRAATLVGNVVFVGAGTTPTEYTLDATTGAILWKTLVANGSGPFTTSPVAADGLVIQGLDRFLFAWDAATGIQRWVVPLPVWGVPAIAGGVVFVTVARNSGTLVALRETTGETLWQSPWVSGGAIWRSPIVAGGLVITAQSLGTEGQLTAYPAQGCTAGACKPVWQYQSLVAGPIGEGAVAAGVVYQGFTDGTIVALDLQSGRLLWKAAITDTATARSDTPMSTTIANGLLYGTDAGGTTFAWPAEGCGAALCQPLWSDVVGGTSLTGQEIQILDGRMYVVASDGYVHAYSPRLNPSPGTKPPAITGTGTPPPPPGPFPPTTIQVPRDQLSIQRAIDASHPGDVVLVAPGIYHERLDFHGHAVEVRSSDGPATTIIDGDSVSPVVVLQSGETRASILRGFTIRRGVAQGRGAAISVLRASATIAGNVVVDNFGSAIAVSDGSALVEDNQIRRNSGGTEGGGVSIANAAGSQVVGNLIEDNSTTISGGGLSVSGPGPLVVADNVIRRNVAADAGGGMAVGAMDMLVVQNVVTDNSARSSGGGISIEFAPQSHPTLLANTIASNAAASGSGIAVGYSTAQGGVVDNIVTGAPGPSLVECDYASSDFVPAFSFNDVYTAAPSPIVGCGAAAASVGAISADPRYVNPGTGDYRLAAGSPAIDAGDGSSGSLPPVDVLGAARVADGNGDGTKTIDLGAYEAQLPIPTVDAGGRFHTLAPARILDTRTGLGNVSRPGPGGSINLQVTGQGGVPATGVSAVVLNVTVTDPTAGGFVTAWPAGAARPTVSNLNFVPGQTVPNLVIVKVGDGGRVSLYNSAGSTQLVADVAGWFGADGAPGGSGYTALPPARILDTRSGLGGATRVGPGAAINLQVTGQGGVPATGVSAVVLNVTVSDAIGSGFVTAWPMGAALPTVSNLNFVAGQTVPNLVVVKVGDGGRVSLYNSAGSTQLVADVAGWISI